MAIRYKIKTLEELAVFFEQHAITAKIAFESKRNFSLECLKAEGMRLAYQHVVDVLRSTDIEPT